MTIFSAGILLLMVMDPFGNIPMFLSVLGGVAPERRQKVVARELLIALLVLLVFFFGGHPLLHVLRISQPSLYMAGGIILLLIAVKMTFGMPEEMFRGNPEGEPFIVPLAIPSVAGPSAVATVLIIRAQQPGRWPEWLVALFGAWLAASVILLLASRLERILRKRGLIALQRLMGLILTTIAVEMFLTGLRFLTGP